MASMASMLARATSSASAAYRSSRAAALASARAARSAAAARRAAAAVSRAARSSTAAAAAAAADLAFGTSFREARSLRCVATMNGRLLGGVGSAPRVPLGSDSSHIDSCLFPDDKLQTPVVDEAKEFVADEKDLESDEALWSLYERWCKHFNQERDRDEMSRRFDEFKRLVLFVHQENNSDRPYKLAINQFTDGKLYEVCLGANNAFHREEIAKLAKLPKTGSWFVWLDGKYYMEVPAECQPDYP